MKYIESKTFCLNITTRYNYVSAVNKDLVVTALPSSSSSSSQTSPYRQLCGTFIWLLTLVWHVLSTILLIFGCPVDRFSAYIASLWHRIVSTFSNCGYRVVSWCSSVTSGSALSSDVSLTSMTVSTGSVNSNRVGRQDVPRVNPSYRPLDRHDARSSTEGRAIDIAMPMDIWRGKRERERVRNNAPLGAAVLLYYCTTRCVNCTYGNTSWRKFK